MRVSPKVELKAVLMVMLSAEYSVVMRAEKLVKQMVRLLESPKVACSADNLVVEWVYMKDDCLVVRKDLRKAERMVELKAGTKEFQTDGYAVD